MAGKSDKSKKSADIGEDQGTKARPRARPRGRSLLLLALLVSFGLLIVGLLTPALHVSSFGFLNDEVSILGSIQAFRDDGQVFLALLLFVVSVGFPLIKITLALLLTLSFNVENRKSHSLAAGLAELARWSMTDVFILAVAVMVIDARLISSANLLPGAYYFTAAVLLSSASVHYLRGSLKRHAARAKDNA